MTIGPKWFTQRRTEETTIPRSANKSSTSTVVVETSVAATKKVLHEGLDFATDALCSSSDETHDALLTVYENRYSQQVEAVTTDVILKNWT
jgi:hypothetical protein